jgi:hypothetical protein
MTVSLCCVHKKNDIIAIVSQLNAAQVFAYIPGREYNSFSAFTDIFSRIKIPDLHKWITGNNTRIVNDTFLDWFQSNS